MHRRRTEMPQSKVGWLLLHKLKETQAVLFRHRCAHSSTPPTCTGGTKSALAAYMSGYGGRKDPKGSVAYVERVQAARAARKAQPTTHTARLLDLAHARTPEPHAAHSHVHTLTLTNSHSHTFVAK